MRRGLLIGGAVFPAAFAITWKGQTQAGALSGAVTGLCAGLIAWLVTAHQYYGSVSVTTTGMVRTLRGKSFLYESKLGPNSIFWGLEAPSFLRNCIITGVACLQPSPFSALYPGSTTLTPKSA